MTPRLGKRPARVIFFAGLVATIASGCGSSPSGSSSPDDETTRSQVPGIEELRTARLIGFDQEVELVDGAWEGPPYVEGGASRPALNLLDLDPLSGDLDGDGLQEAVSIVSQTSGGTGNNLHLVAFVLRAGSAIEKASTLVGDRVQIRSFDLEGHTVALRLVQTGPEDAACCPGEKITRRWNLTGAGWAEIEPTPEGRLSTADLAGISWQLTHFSWDETASNEPAITLHVQDGQISGSSGCNRYTGSIRDGESPGDMEIGPIAATRRACPPPIMDAEQLYLEALAAANRFTFLAGDLALTYVIDQQWRTLRFTAEPGLSPAD